MTGASDNPMVPDLELKKLLASDQICVITRAVLVKNYTFTVD